jgi:fructosamine-3-kinase
MTPWRDEVERVTGQRVLASARLTGGCVAEVWRADLAGGGRVVAKVAGAQGSLHIEGFMLRYLAAHSRLPVPRVLHASPELLVIEFVEGASEFSGDAERHAAELLADLHGQHGPWFGFEQDTLIGPLPQPNPRSPSWIEFFRDHRLLAMARTAAECGHLPPATHERIEKLARDLAGILEEPAQPSLLHGDIWTTNVLSANGRITGILDPAIYCGHPEIELAFITLFSTFGREFFDEYHRLRPIRPGFFERRRHVYNLYPLLVHTALFGSGYAARVSTTLRTLGY